MNAERKRNAGRRGLSGRSTRFSRGFLIAGALVLFAAVFMFWPRGGDHSPAIGERYSVVTAGSDQSASGLPTAIRSGEVELDNEVDELVPEQPDDAGPAGTSDSPPEDRATSMPPVGTDPGTAEPVTKPATRPAATQPRQQPTTPPLSPQAAGDWLVQVGAFGNQENAETLRSVLREAGYPVLMRTGSRSDGQLVSRICVGYFRTRADAVTFARQHRQALGGEGIPVHR